MRERWEDLETEEEKKEFIRYNVCPECEDTEGGCNKELSTKSQLEQCTKSAEKNPDEFFQQKLKRLE